MKPTKLTLDENNEVMTKMKLFRKNTTLRKKLTEDEKSENCAKQGLHCLRNSLLPFEHEVTCIACGCNITKKMNVVRFQWKKSSIDWNMVKNLLYVYV